MKGDTAKRLLIVSVVAALIAGYFIFDLGEYFTLEYIKLSKERFQALYVDHAFLILGAYFLLYVVITALALPAATILTLAGGALFGFWTGVVVVSFASSIGAALAFVMARYIMKDWVQGKFGDKLDKINQGMEKDGAFYLFTLRLIPIFPFFVINALVALTPMRLWTYYWVSQIGMFPATLVYVNAGRELGKLESMSGLFSPSLLASFVLLGVFPLVVKKALGWYQRGRRNG